MILFPDRYYWKKDISMEDTHWYRFQKTIKEHQEAGIRLLRPLFEQMGMDINSD